MIEFSEKIVKGTLERRYKRFLADVILETGEKIVAHCPNTGAMTSCGSPGDTVYLSYHDNPKRKLKYTWEYTLVPKGLVGINTMRPNRAVEAAFSLGQIEGFQQYETVTREVKFSEGTRFDLKLEQSKLNSCYVEIKNVTLVKDGELQFPDAVTKRGLKHLHSLVAAIRQGNRGLLFFFVNRPEGTRFRVAKEIDPEYAKGLEWAVTQGLEVVAYRSKASPNRLGVGSPVKVEL